MKSILTISILAMAVLLSACGGGSSDSSGTQAFKEQIENSSRQHYEMRFFGLTSCQIDTNSRIIYVDSKAISQKCKVKLPELNDGLSFSLQCLRQTNVLIKGESKHIEALKNMVKTGHPYTVICK